MLAVLLLQILKKTKLVFPNYAIHANTILGLHTGIHFRNLVPRVLTPLD